MIRLRNPFDRLQRPNPASAPPGAQPDRRAGEAAARRDLLLLFESLGENCELGFVQEHLDAHPISLFRWSGIDGASLVSALDSDLEGIGEAQHTLLKVDASTGEYFFQDDRYGMHTHTRIFEREEPLERVARTITARTRRLREKLLEDLEEGRRIFVFNATEPLREGERDRLAASVRRLGPGAELFCVSPDPGGGRVGQVRRIGPGLTEGWLDVAGRAEDGWLISYQLWLDLLAQAARLCGREVDAAAQASLAGLQLPYGPR